MNLFFIMKKELCFEYLLANFMYYSIKVRDLLYQTLLKLKKKKQMKYTCKKQENEEKKSTVQTNSK